jgi:signal transduction histidine kinase
MAVREIVHAFLHADRPQEVFQFALDRVAPLVGASFASIYLMDGVSEVMNLVASYNWPEQHRPWLGETRVRLGFGPSGEAAAERRIIDVPDVFADADLEDWQEIANELGFRSLVALPLQTARRVLGAVTFYFAETGSRSVEARNLLRIVADQMAATAEKSALIDDLRRTNTALSESNEELERQYVQVLVARRVKNEFLMNISHELKTPLTSVLGYLSIIRDELSGPLTEGQREDLRQATGASERLLELIEDLLELATLKRGEGDLVLEDIDPLQLIQDVAAAVPGRPAEVELHLSAAPGEVSGSVPQMRSDRKKITKILVTLLGNAYKFTIRGTVAMWAELEDDGVVFHVRDTGIGIPAEARQYVFDEFRQVDGSVTRRYGGSGLGLALARGYARVLGGDIEVESNQGMGSTFSVRLPFEHDGRMPLINDP